MRSRLWQAFIVLASLSLTVPLMSAEDLASITGSVTDPTGAAIPGAKVELTNAATGISFQQTTDEIGTYRFLKVPPGTGYKLTITHEGFATGIISEVPLSVGITRTQNIALAVGAESQLRPVRFHSVRRTKDTTGDIADVVGKSAHCTGVTDRRHPAGRTARGIPEPAPRSRFGSETCSRVRPKALR